MTERQRQEEEAATIRDRVLSLQLSDADVKRIQEKAGCAGMTVGELVSLFIGDLVNGTNSSGSDERMYLNQWFERCSLSGSMVNSFLRYLLQSGKAYDVLSSIESLELNKNDVAAITAKLNDKNYSWESVIMRSKENPDGVRAYATKEDWQRDGNEQIEAAREEISFCESSIDEAWNEFIAFAGGADFDKANEIKAVQAWGAAAEQGMI